MNPETADVLFVVIDKHNTIRFYEFCTTSRNAVAPQNSMTIPLIGGCYEKQFDILPSLKQGDSY